MAFPTVTGAGIALVITAIATPLTVFLSWLEQHRAADRKEQKDEEDRKAAREASLAALKELADEQRATHSLVDGHNTALTGEVVALKDAISKSTPIPTMLAKDAAPAQVTQDGGVISVGKVDPHPEEKS